MIRKATILYCDNEHGIGDVTFPDILNVLPILPVDRLQRTVRGLRQDAKKAGWGRVNGGDYCPACMESL